MFELDFSLNRPLFLVFAILVMAWLAQMIYYWFVFGRLAFSKKKNINSTHAPVSVIICAKNECMNLKKFLPKILEQDYPEFEVVVVDDGSDDDTDYLLKDLKKVYPHLTIVDFKKNVNFFIGKKFPLALGIKSAKHDILVLTDADCYPRSTQWLKHIQAHYANNEKQIVLAYSPYIPEKGLLNRLIRYDTFFVGVQYMSYALCGMPYMGVGRNLSYHRSLFVNTKGFSSHYHISSGDDDIFINQVAHAKNVAVAYEPAAHTVSIPKKSWLAWFKQKRRHFTTYKYYKKRHKTVLGLYSLSNAGFYAVFILLAAFGYNIPIILALLILKLITQWVVLKKCANKLNEKKILLFSPIFDLIITVLNPLVALTNLLSKQRKWN